MTATQNDAFGKLKIIVKVDDGKEAQAACVWASEVERGSSYEVIRACLKECKNRLNGFTLKYNSCLNPSKTSLTFIAKLDKQILFSAWSGLIPEEIASSDLGDIFDELLISQTLNIKFHFENYLQQPKYLEKPRRTKHVSAAH